MNLLRFRLELDWKVLRKENREKKKIKKKKIYIYIYIYIYMFELNQLIIYVY